MQTLKSQRIVHFDHKEKRIISNKPAGLPLSVKPGHKVNSYEELLEKVAQLNFYNPGLQLYFRGQKKDYFNYNKDGKPIRSNLYPSLLRGLPIEKSKRRALVEKRVEKLNKADKLLLQYFDNGYLHRHQLVRWAILQHYEICYTPFLDITPSLQSALSFAITKTNNEGYIYVLGLPQQNGAITVSIESMTQLIDLSKLCPPEASRPHFQSGYLVADYPTAIYKEELVQKVPRVSGNFACRLVTKFHLVNTKQWIKGHFNPTPSNIIYPNNRDKWFPILDKIKKSL